MKRRGTIGGRRKKFIKKHGLKAHIERLKTVVNSLHPVRGEDLARKFNKAIKKLEKIAEKAT